MAIFFLNESMNLQTSKIKLIFYHSKRNDNQERNGKMRVCLFTKTNCKEF